MNNFVIVVPTYNCEDWIERTIESTRIQTYSNFKCCIIDDQSTDRTFEIAKKAIRGDKRFFLKSNKERKLAMYNIYHGFLYASEHKEDILITLDGDDWFYDDKVLEKVNAVYEKTDCLITYGSFVEYPSGVTHPYYWTSYDDNVIKNNLFRDVPWKASHLKTFKRKLFDLIRKDDLIDPRTNEFYEVASDLALMFPMMEMAAERSRHIAESLYYYNKTNPMSDMYIKEAKQMSTAEFIRNQPRYSKVKL
jgi:glycosyltransferase involved in cell wall biosynthesis